MYRPGVAWQRVCLVQREAGIHRESYSSACIAGVERAALFGVCGGGACSARQRRHPGRVGCPTCAAATAGFQPVRAVDHGTAEGSGGDHDRVAELLPGADQAQAVTRSTALMSPGHRSTNPIILACCLDVGYYYPDRKSVV